MSSSPRPTFDPRRIVEELHDHGVSYVVVGGVAARLHGSPTVTTDFDLTPELSEENLERLAAALRSMRPAKIVPRFRRPVPTAVDASDLRAQAISSYVTRWGRVDVLRVILGRGGYDELAPQAVAYDVGGGLVIAAASLDDIIASKEAAAETRTKDRAQLPALYELRDELRERLPQATTPTEPLAPVEPVRRRRPPHDGTADEPRET